MVTRALVGIAAVALGCQSREAPPRVEGGSGSGTSVRGSGASEVGSAIAEPDVPDVDRKPKHEEPEHDDPGKQLVALGAVPAWQAVVDRAQYLERRGQKGVAYGTLEGMGGSASAGSASSGSASTGSASPYVWLVDDTEGNGALAIRAALPSPQTSGDRVALAGAWALDAERRWYWHATAVTPLPPSTHTSKDPLAAPGHTITSGPIPPGARPIGKADDDALVYFTVAGPPPVLDGDGWPVADDGGGNVIAIVSLPGERASYGAQDLRTPDERWTLKRGQTYWLRVGIVHKRGPDKPMTMTARTAPVRVP